MTREELKKQTIIILNREDITIEEMTENILQLVDVAISKELRLYGVVNTSSCGNCGSYDIDKEENFCNNCSEYLDY